MVETPVRHRPRVAGRSHYGAWTRGAVGAGGPARGAVDALAAPGTRHGGGQTGRGGRNGGAAPRRPGISREAASHGLRPRPPHVGLVERVEDRLEQRVDARGPRRDVGRGKLVRRRRFHRGEEAGVREPGEVAGPPRTSPPPRGGTPRARRRARRPGRGVTAKPAAARVWPVQPKTFGVNHGDPDCTHHRAAGSDHAARASGRTRRCRASRAPRCAGRAGPSARGPTGGSPVRRGPRGRS